VSYARMDHAGWVESNNSAINRDQSKRKNFKPLPEKLNEFQSRVADILGIVGGGIYNAPISHENVKWDYGFCGVSVTWRGGFATWDRGELTMLVVLCHEARIRCEVEPAGPHLLRISFWARTECGGVSERHPSIDEAVTRIREYLPADHRIRFVSEVVNGR
jgi:hypothetical protein